MHSVLVDLYNETNNNSNDGERECVSSSFGRPRRQGAVRVWGSAGSVGGHGRMTIGRCSEFGISSSQILRFDSFDLKSAID